MSSKQQLKCALPVHAHQYLEDSKNFQSKGSLGLAIVEADNLLQMVLYESKQVLLWTEKMEKIKLKVQNNLYLYLEFQPKDQMSLSKWTLHLLSKNDLLKLCYYYVQSQFQSKFPRRFTWLDLGNEYAPMTFGHSNNEKPQLNDLLTIHYRLHTLQQVYIDQAYEKVQIRFGQQILPQPGNFLLQNLQESIIGMKIGESRFCQIPSDPLNVYEICLIALVPSFSSEEKQKGVGSTEVDASSFIPLPNLLIENDTNSGIKSPPPFFSQPQPQPAIQQPIQAPLQSSQSAPASQYFQPAVTDPHSRIYQPTALVQQPLSYLPMANDTTAWVLLDLQRKISELTTERKPAASFNSDSSQILGQLESFLKSHESIQEQIKQLQQQLKDANEKIISLENEKSELLKEKKTLLSNQNQVLLQTLSELETSQTDYFQQQHKSRMEILNIKQMFKNQMSEREMEFQSEKEVLMNEHLNEKMNWQNEKSQLEKEILNIKQMFKNQMSEREMEFQSEKEILINEHLNEKMNWQNEKSQLEKEILDYKNEMKQKNEKEKLEKEKPDKELESIYDTASESLSFNEKEVENEDNSELEEIEELPEEEKEQEKTKLEPLSPSVESIEIEKPEEEKEQEKTKPESLFPSVEDINEKEETKSEKEIILSSQELLLSEEKNAPVTKENIKLFDEDENDNEAEEEKEINETPVKKENIKLFDDEDDEDYFFSKKSTWLQTPAASISTNKPLFEDSKPDQKRLTRVDKDPLSMLFDDD